MFPEIKFSLHTRTLSCIYLDTFLIAKPDTRPSVYRLLAVTTLCLAIRYEENIVITPQQISKFFDNKFSVDTIKTLELYILKTLNWNLVRITPSYIIRLLLESTCDGNDYSKIIQKAEVLAMVGMLNTPIAKSGEFLLSTAAVSLALELMGFSVFLEEWWAEITTIVNISRADVQNIEQRIFEIIS